MELAAKLDDYGKPAWIAVMVLGFIVFWPIGLAILAYLIWSGRMGCWGMRGAGRWHGAQNGKSNGFRAHNRSRESSGNAAFDEYREETLRRLEDEQAEFFAFLERLRQAKDKAEFDQFMAEQKGRAQRPGGPEAPGDAAPQPQA